MKCFSLIHLSSINDDLNLKIDKMCSEYNIEITRITNLCDMFDVLNFKKVDFLILDDKVFPIYADLLYIFQRKNYYVPFVFILTNKRITIKESNVLKYRFSEYNKLEEYIINYTITHEKRSINKTNDIKNKIYLELCKLGFNQKYKGFSYLVEILTKMYFADGAIKSFRKFIYPYISSLFCVSEESVERDVRNVLKIQYQKSIFRQKISFNDRQLAPTTRNIINVLMIYLKNGLT